MEQGSIMNKDAERAQVQLAGCLMASEGNTELDGKDDSYGWSLAYQQIVDLYRNRDRLILKMDELIWGHHIDEGCVCCECDNCKRYRKYIDCGIE